MVGGARNGKTYLAPPTIVLANAQILKHAVLYGATTIKGRIAYFLHVKRNRKLFDISQSETGPWSYT